MRMRSPNVDNVNMEDAPPTLPAPIDRTYHHGDLRNALIEAGLKALTHQEAGELSLRALARELGVSANAVYRHFESKEALLSALAAEGFRRFARSQADARNDTVSGEVATGLAYVRFAQLNPALFRLMFGGFVHAGQGGELQGAATEAFAGLLQDSMAPGQRVGEGPIDEATLMRALARWSLVHGLSHLLLEGQLGLFGADPQGLIPAVLRASGMASGVASGVAQPGQARSAKAQTGKPSRKASS